MNKYYLFSLTSLLLFVHSVESMEDGRCHCNTCVNHLGRPARIAEEPQGFFPGHLLQIPGIERHGLIRLPCVVDGPDVLVPEQRAVAQPVLSPEETAATTVVRVLEEKLECVDKSNEDELLEHACAVVAHISLPMRALVHKFFFDMCSKKIYRDDFLNFNRCQWEFRGGTRLYYCGTRDLVKKTCADTTVFNPDPQAAGNLREWRALTLEELIGRYCTVHCANKMGREFPTIFRDENPLFYE